MKLGGSGRGPGPRPLGRGRPGSGPPRGRFPRNDRPQDYQPGYFDQPGTPDEAGIPDAAPGAQRLALALATAGVDSRRHCEALIREGKVTVDGEVVTDPATKVDIRQQHVEFQGELIRPEPKAYWFLNKPKGVLCTNRDPDGRKTIFDLIPPIGRRVFSVGRLDEDSTGLLLLTNDGEMALRLTHPRYGVTKTYSVIVAGRVTGSTLLELKKGVWLSDGKVRPLAIHREGMRGQSTQLSIVLAEGHNREIRRMFAKVGHKVMSLDRIAIGPIKIRQLRVGDARPASRDELRMLRELAFQPPKSARPNQPLRARPTRRTEEDSPASADDGSMGKGIAGDTRPPKKGHARRPAIRKRSRPPQDESTDSE